MCGVVLVCLQVWWGQTDSWWWCWCCQRPRLEELKWPSEWCAHCVTASLRNFIHQAINGVTLATHVFWDQNSLFPNLRKDLLYALPNLRKDLLCALPNVLQLVCPSLLLLGIGRSVGSALCQKPLNTHVFIQLTHFNTVPKDCGPLETGIHNLASRAPGNHM